MRPFMFLFDKFSDCKNKVLFICSSTTQLKSLPKELGERFIYSLCIRPTPLNMKFNLFKFIANNSGINLNMSDQEIYNVTNNLRNYSNGDIFQVIKLANDYKKQNDDLSNGVTLDYINKALQVVPGTITPLLLQCYYL